MMPISYKQEKGTQKGFVPGRARRDPAPFHRPLWYILSENAGSHGNYIFYLLRNCKLIVPKWLRHFTIPPTLYEGSSFSTYYQHLLLSLILAITVGKKWYIIGFNLNFSDA